MVWRQVAESGPAYRGYLDTSERTAFHIFAPDKVSPAS